jgi:hypothetical protein
MAHLQHRGQTHQNDETQAKALMAEEREGLTFKV